VVVTSAAMAAAADTKVGMGSTGTRVVVRGGSDGLAEDFQGKQGLGERVGVAASKA
jgi:hypothetical protein